MARSEARASPSPEEEEAARLITLGLEASALEARAARASSCSFLAAITSRSTRSSSALCFAASSSGSMPRMELRLSSVPFAAAFSVSSPAEARAATPRARAPTATRATTRPIERTARGFDATRAGAVAPAPAPRRARASRRARAPAWRRWSPCRTFARLSTRRRVRVKWRAAFNRRGSSTCRVSAWLGDPTRGDLSERLGRVQLNPGFWVRDPRPQEIAPNLTRAAPPGVGAKNRVESRSRRARLPAVRRVLSANSNRIRPVGRAGWTQ